MGSPDNLELAALAGLIWISAMKVVYYILGVIKFAVIGIISVLIVISSSLFDAIF